MYWPENLNESIQYEDVVVEMTNFSQLNKYIIRNFRISMTLYSSNVVGESSSEQPADDFTLEFQNHAHICQFDCQTFGRGYPHSTFVPRWPMCGRCHCDLLCVFYRDCCPDVILNGHVSDYNITNDDVTECVGLIPFPYLNRTLELSEYAAMVSRCPRDRQSSPDTDRCHRPDISLMDQTFPVYSDITGHTYRNIYCARCHGLDLGHVSNWTVDLWCDTTPELLIQRTRTREDIFKLLFSYDGVNATGCHVAYTPDGRGSQRTCTTRDQQVTSACNVSGQVEYFPKDMEDACASYTSVFGSAYRNMFCYLCNKSPTHLEMFRQLVQYGYTGHVARVSYQALVDFRGLGEEQQEAPPTRELTDCPAGAFYDSTTCSCREPKCGEARYRADNATCRGFLVSQLLGYNVCLRVSFKSDQTNISQMAVRSIQNHLVNGNRADFVLIKFSVYIDEWCEGGKTASVLLRANVAMRESVELSAADEAVEKLKTDVVEIVTFIMNGDLDGEVEVVAAPHSDCQGWGAQSFPCPAERDVSLRVRESYGMLMLSLSRLVKNIYYMNYYETNKCLFVEFSKENFTDIDKANVYILSSNVTIPRSKVEIIDSESVRICVSDYLHLLRPPTEVCLGIESGSDYFDTWTTSGLVSIVCTCVSLSCLLLTFVTYVTVPTLRSGGGKSIVMLTGAYILAQASYEFTIEQFENPLLCSCFGVFIHASWLFAIFATNACTLERFYKLRFPLSSRSFFLSQKPFFLATFYSIGMPVTIVALTIIVNQLTRYDLGYGSPRVCFINNSVSVVVAFAAPLGLVVLVNVCLMVVTVWHLRRRSNFGDGSSFHNKLGLFACVRLSFVTGVTWALAFLYDVIDQEVVGYVITGLIGLQGLMFSFSMLVNSRVKDSYRQLFPSQRKNKTTSGAKAPYVVTSRQPQSSSQDATKSSEIADSNDVTVSTSEGKENTAISPVPSAGQEA
ncbi:uncharacterized protein LOC101853386 [Aplysia californica]|uniref:Uncharacterized protein LOC101853386 n=1 Tax=Aplysia californica TaxID=6500 RepID=A0ABM0JPB7_APLCA|nr:uncharacterized protein LOC101853386 [Aplysia californica]